MLPAVDVIAGIAWEPEIRGLLTVVLSTAILMGSVWLLLVTNTGMRLGTLIALTGAMAWIAIMTFIWAIYGIGLLGDRPVWNVTEIVFGSPSEASTLVVTDLPETDVLPTGVELVRDSGNAELIAEFDTVDEEAIREDRTLRNDALADGDPRKLTDEELEAAIALDVARAEARNAQISLSDVKAVDSDLVDSVIDLDDWNLESAADAGEAVAAAEAALTENGVFEASDDFVVQNVYQRGGKPQRASNGMWDRVTNKVVTSVMLWNPTNYTVVQVQGAQVLEAAPGEPPPPTLIDDEQTVVSVVMVRDLGNFRQPAQLGFVGSLAIFLALALMLHTRDLELRKRQAELESTAG